MYECRPLEKGGQRWERLAKMPPELERMVRRSKEPQFKHYQTELQDETQGMNQPVSGTVKDDRGTSPLNDGEMVSRWNVGGQQWPFPAIKDWDDGTGDGSAV